MYRSIVMAGSSHVEFANLLAQHLNCTSASVLRAHFANGETRFELHESLRGADVFIVQTHCGCVNDMLIELLIMIQTSRYAGAHKVIAVLPFFPYARQDKMHARNTPITAKLVANLLESAGVDSVLTLDFHAPQIQGFFNVPCDNLTAVPLIEDWLQLNVANWQNMVLVAPDHDAVKRVTNMSTNLGVTFAVVHKDQRMSNALHDIVLVGDVRHKIAVLVDDIVDTGKTLCLAADKLVEAGAAQVYAVVVHGIFSGGAVQKLTKSPITMIVCTNSLPQSAALTTNPKFRVIDTIPVFRQTIASMLSNDHANDSKRPLLMTNEALKELQELEDQHCSATSPR